MKKYQVVLEVQADNVADAVSNVAEPSKVQFVSVKEVSVCPVCVGRPPKNQPCASCGKQSAGK